MDVTSVVAATPKMFLSDIVNLSSPVHLFVVHLDISFRQIFFTTRATIHVLRVAIGPKGFIFINHASFASFKTLCNIKSASGLLA